MKKVIVETECGEETQFYMSQDVDSITVDGEEWVKKIKEDEEEKITVKFETSEDDDIEDYGAECAFEADFSNGVWIYANSDGRVEYISPTTRGWVVLQKPNKA